MDPMRTFLFFFPLAFSHQDQRINYLKLNLVLKVCFEKRGLPIMLAENILIRILSWSVKVSNCLQFCPYFSEFYDMLIFKSMVLKIRLPLTLSLLEATSVLISTMFAPSKYNDNLLLRLII
ncbi:hypothetical protein KC19_2G269500 [Ceratodon purpureus]|uniref:Uncharacterized protein n=1 Tax=Ceratodon purpureus TaxID=3225 RepID=A0A8T0IYJ9_CERPU|nr:hypothetical protein KC19_2G269500 [Ceratodon purpureus]